jgi:hypothetical protein
MVFGLVMMILTIAVWLKRLVMAMFGSAILRAKNVMIGVLVWSVKMVMSFLMGNV